MAKSLIRKPEKDFPRHKSHLLPSPEPVLIPDNPFHKIIPVCAPVLDEREKRKVLECIDSGWISSLGEKIGEFERKFAEKVGAKYGIAVTSGTTALHLVLYTLGIGEGDEVIVPTFTMIATANAVRYCGAKPVLVDSEPRTGNIDVEKIEEKITSRTRAIIPIHTYGHPAEMDKILALAKKYDLWVIEDAAEAHGAEYKGRKIGSIGDAATFSFYANKIITTGEGGMITTNNSEIYEIARNLRDHAFSQEMHFWHKLVGFNYRMTNLQAAIGLAQLEKFDELVEKRIENARLYTSLLKDIEGLVLPPETEGIKNVFWMYGIRVKDSFGISRDELRERLARKGIETRTFFIPIHLQPIYWKDYVNEDFPVSEALCKEGLYLPSSSGLKKEEIYFIAETIRGIKKGVGS